MSAAVERLAERRWPFAHRTMLAPMEGVGHPEFRRIMAEHGGLGIVCTEFVRISRAPLVPKSLERAVVKCPGLPLSVQVMGNEVDKMAEAAAVVSAVGADVVDINLGCPAPKAVRHGVGSAMLRDPELLHRVLVAMRRRVPGLLSAKIRAGFDDQSAVLDIAQAVEAAGVDYLVVHPRRRADFYRGVADWRIIRLLAETLRIPVVGNGDCWYAADAGRMRAQTGCVAVMIGRPALRNPWIFEQIADLEAGRTPRRPAGSELVAHLARVTARYRAAFPGRRGPVGKIKELLTYLGRAVDDGGAFRSSVLRLSDLDQILAHAEATLLHLPAERIDLDAHGSLRLETSGLVD